MQLMVCGNVMVGDAGALNMPPQLLGVWQRDKVRALACAIERACERGAERVLVAGGLFSEGFIPQSLLELGMDALGQCGLPVTYAPLLGEVADLEERVEVPVNVTVVRADACEPVPGLRVLHGNAGVELGYTTGEGARLMELPPLEPQGFDVGCTCGFYLFEVSGSDCGDDGAHVVPAPEFEACAVHSFRVLRVSMDGVATSREMLDKVRDTIEGVGDDVCLRLELRGKTPVQAYFNTDELATVLSRRFFYAEVANECGVDISMDELEGDVSLVAEFLRSVQADDSLSPTEKARIMRCGWNALNGKELAE